jgi:uridylate kinase
VVGSSRTNPLSNPRWKRVLLKIGGTALAGAAPQNVDPKIIMLIAREVQVACHHGVEVAIVVGGRNIFCGDNWVASTGTDRASTYPIGMMASVMNSVLLQASLEKIGVETRVQTALTIQEVAEPYVRRRAIRHLEKGRVVIFGGIGAGIGNPLFTTDTAAALRASEINADVVLKGIVGDDEYGCPPRGNSNTPFEHISFRELAARGFSRMDMTAVTCCEENNIPVVIFNMLEPGNISRAICGDQIGTLVDQSGRIT